LHKVSSSCIYDGSEQKYGVHHEHDAVDENQANVVEGEVGWKGLPVVNVFLFSVVSSLKHPDGQRNASGEEAKETRLPELDVKVDGLGLQEQFARPQTTLHAYEHVLFVEYVEHLGVEVVPEFVEPAFDDVVNTSVVLDDAFVQLPFFDKRKVGPRFPVSCSHIVCAFEQIPVFSFVVILFGKLSLDCLLNGTNCEEIKEFFDDDVAVH